MILYHWTLQDRSEAIRRDGFRATTYDAGGDGVVGVWVCDDASVWRQGYDVCVVIDVPDHALDSAWAAFSAHPTATDWRLPPNIADRYLVRR